MTRYFLVPLSFFLLTACLTIENKFSGLPPGIWRATLDVNPIIGGPPVAELEEQVFNYDDTPPNYLPFTFEVIYEDENDFYIEIINGTERIPVKDITFGRNKILKDTFRIDFPIYESYITGIYSERVMQGEWVVTTRKNYAIPFVAKHGKDYRFSQLRETPKMDVSGTWAVQFEDADGPYIGVGEFVQEGNELTGTFRTETGDYRYLEGTIQEGKLFLSVFDGAHAFLFEAKIMEDQSLIGTFKSGKHYKATWTATKDANAKLGDPNSLTYLKEGYEEFDFAFENEKGQLISLKDERYQDKIKVVQIFGTWCPNCKDETAFLVDYFKQHPTNDVEVIGLAFEKHKEKEKAQKILKKYKERMDIGYELLIAGTSDKKEAAKSLPMLNHILSYPTLIFLDKQNKVRKIHTGFAGPATSKFEAFGEEFEETITLLVKEN